MALIQVEFLSDCLMRTVTLNAIIPFDKIVLPGMKKQEVKPFKTLYLLHGIFGSYQDWVSGTCIRRWAEDKNLAVIMPSGENHFYVDCKANGERFGEFIGRELPEKMRELFPLSRDREDTFIGGLSMGGYGAIINGLKYRSTFGHIAGLSSSLVLEDMQSGKPELTELIFGKEFHRTLFGSQITGSDNDYYCLAQQVSKEGGAVPKFYLCCGTEDELLENNRRFAGFLKEQGFSVTYEEGPGNHSWEFWNTYIKKILDWLSLDNESDSIHSGNISGGNSE